MLSPLSFFYPGCSTPRTCFTLLVLRSLNSQHTVPWMYFISTSIHLYILSHFSLSLGILANCKSSPSLLPSLWLFIFRKNAHALFSSSCSCSSLVPVSCSYRNSCLHFFLFFSSPLSVSRLVAPMSMETTGRQVGNTISWISDKL